jgi:hypothetical protein
MWRRDAAIALLACASVACFESDTTTTDGGNDVNANEASCVGFCFGDASGPIDPFGDASLAVRSRALFGSTCAGSPESGCHSEGAGDTYLKADVDGGDLIDVPSFEIPSVLRIAPFDADASYVYWKVTGDPRIDGGQMPLGGPFDPRIPELVGSWIEAGAP